MSLQRSAMSGARDVSAADTAPDATPELTLRVESVRATEFAAVPTLSFTLRVESAGELSIRSVALESQIRIAATRRSYDAAAQERLAELFGTPDRWGTTVRSLLWTHASVQVPPFTGRTLVELPVTCTYDFDVVVVKYFAALREGEIPLEFLFSGTVFYGDGGGRLRTVRLPWTAEATFRFPVRVWTEMMAHYFPNSAWLRLRTETFDRLAAFKTRRLLSSWDDAIGTLLGDGAGEAEG